MDISGTIIQILPEVSGTSKTGSVWRKQDYILETKDQFPKKVCFNVWGDKIDQFAINVGDEATVSFDLESREYNSRWYTEVKAWKVQKGASTPASSNQVVAESQASYMVPPPLEADPGDDLPF